MIFIVDYGMGNLHSIAKAFEYVGAEVKISSDAKEISRADKIVLPGVGAFRDGMENLKKQGLDVVLRKEVLENKKPFLGICLGMQLLADKSFEFGEWNGLGFVSGEVCEFDVDKKLKVPHVGWNDVNVLKDAPILSGIKNNSDFYFVHSYHLVCKDKENILGVSDYGGEFTAMINKDNIVAAQFHPEKSQRDGLKLLKNFLEWQV